MANTTTKVPGSGYGNAYIDSLIWGRYGWDHTSGPISVYFGQKSDFTKAAAIHGKTDYLPNADAAISWQQPEMNAFLSVLSKVQQLCGLTFTVAPSVETANIVWWKTDLGGGILGAHEIPAAKQNWGYFNSLLTGSWNNMRPGGDGLYLIIHELGHGLGLAHPHDGGGEEDATTFPGVGSPGDTGKYDLNQAIWTAMSYNRGWNEAPYTGSFGGQASFAAFDIAALQTLYGANTLTARGNDVYVLPKANEPGTGWSSIWDNAGIDTVSAISATDDVMIDLRAASLAQGDPNAGGHVSAQWGIGGGFTIAYGVVIENATGGPGDDKLNGNEVANRLRGLAGDDLLYGFGENDVLRGDAGDDFLLGNAGDDSLFGGSGTDTLRGGPGHDVFGFSSWPNGETNRDRLPDFNVKDDTIWLDNAVFKKLGKGSEANPGKLNKSFFRLGDEARDRNDFVVYNPKSGLLSYDQDGAGPKDSVEVALFSKGLKMTYHDIFVT